MVKQEEKSRPPIMELAVALVLCTVIITAPSVSEAVSGPQQVGKLWSGSALASSMGIEIPAHHGLSSSGGMEPTSHVGPSRVPESVWPLGLALFWLVGMARRKAK